jgi:hypothetical protein
MAKYSKSAYETFAHILKTERIRIDSQIRESDAVELNGRPDALEGAYQEVSLIAQEMARLFALDNPRFDVNRFLEATYPLKQEAQAERRFDRQPEPNY